MYQRIWWLTTTRLLLDRGFEFSLWESDADHVPFGIESTPSWEGEEVSQWTKIPSVELIGFSRKYKWARCSYSPLSKTRMSNVTAKSLWVGPFQVVWVPASWTTKQSAVSFLFFSSVLGYHCQLSTWLASLLVIRVDALKDFIGRCALGAAALVWCSG